MLILLTNRCTMGCSHCMSDCTSEGMDMTPETLSAVLDFAKKQNVPQLMFSGGEIFEIPLENLKCLLDVIAEKMAGRSVIFASNGRILSRDEKVREVFISFLNKIGKKQVLLQITDDPRFYPSSLTDREKYRLTKMKPDVEIHPVLEGQKRCLYPQGRALQNFTEEYWNTIAPKCINVRLLAMHLGKQQGANRIIGKISQELFFSGKICTPAIAPDGSIKMGESVLCPSIGTIWNTDKEILDGINNCKCSKCKISIEKLRSHNKAVADLFFK